MFRHSDNKVISRSETGNSGDQGSQLKRTISRLSLPRKIGQDKSNSIRSSVGALQRNSITSYSSIKQAEHKTRISLSRSDYQNSTLYSDNEDKQSILSLVNQANVSVQSPQMEDNQIMLRDSLLIYRDKFENKTESEQNSLGNSCVSNKLETVSLELDQPRMGLKSILKRGKGNRASKKRVSFAEHKNQVFVVSKWVKEDKLQSIGFKQEIRRSTTHYFSRTSSPGFVSIYSRDNAQINQGSVRVIRPSLQR